MDQVTLSVVIVLGVFVLYLIILAIIIKWCSTIDTEDDEEDPEQRHVPIAAVLPRERFQPRRGYRPPVVQRVIPVEPFLRGENPPIRMMDREHDEDAPERRNVPVAAVLPRNGHCPPIVQPVVRYIPGENPAILM